MNAPTKRELVFRSRLFETGETFSLYRIERWVLTWRMITIYIYFNIVSSVQSKMLGTLKEHLDRKKRELEQKKDESEQARP